MYFEKVSWPYELIERKKDTPEEADFCLVLMDDAMEPFFSAGI